ncbi:MAG: GGDEF domain-containing protein, partial [Proteobacteria bacterium]|nr:GGDEF domain-containing protein [Pseudomonadota bacterium]
FEEEYLVKEKGFCVMMIDLDHFKEVNDTYGHPVGDLVLAQIGALLITNTRHGDVACRYGGEEFVVLLRGGDSCEAGKIAERVRKAVEEYVFTINEIHPFRKTISIGLACCPLHFGTVNEIIVAADTALYTAKSRGRNQVVMHTSPRMTD